MSTSEAMKRERIWVWPQPKVKIMLLMSDYLWVSQVTKMTSKDLTVVKLEVNLVLESKERWGWLTY